MSEDMLPECAREFGKINECLKNGADRDRHIIRKLDAVAKVILGNGKVGMIGRIDRLEQARSGKWQLITRVVIPLTCAIMGLLTAKLF